jgi:hypothetical protein
METGSSIYEEKTNFNRELVYLNMQTLDSITKGFKAEEKIFLKLDVQGSELDILEGAKQTLSYVDFILLEASVLNYNNNAPLIGEIFKYMNNIDFVLFDICEQKRSGANLLMQVDLLFSKTDSKIRVENNF